MSSCLQNEAVGAYAGNSRSFVRYTAASDDHRPVVAVAASQACTADVLREAADEPNGCSGPERREVVVIDLVLETGITDLIEADELVEPIRAAVRHQQAVERHC